MTKTSFERLSLPRRRVLQGFASGLAVTVLGMPRISRAAGSITVSNWGGDWNDRTVKFVEKPLLEDKGFTVVRDIGMETERKAKLIAEKRIRRSSIDVIHLNSSDAFEMRRQDAVATLGPVDKVDSQISGSMIQDCLLGGGFGSRRPDRYGMADHRGAVAHRAWKKITSRAR